MSFLNPIFLFALGAVVLPVLYHLVRKMKAKQVPFSTLMFLKATPKELVRRRRLRDVLLMAVRALMFGLLALVFARPFLPQNILPFLPEAADQSVVLVLDNSYSMQAGDRFEAARTEALRRLNDAGNDDEFAVVVFSDIVQQATSLSNDRALHRNVLENTIEISNRPTDFYKPLRQAEEILTAARHDDKTIILISDFQQNGWAGSFENWKLAPNIRFIPIKVGEDVSGNAYIEAFNLTRQRDGDRMAVRYDTRIQSDEARSNRASLTVEGEQVDRQNVPALTSNRMTFQQSDLREGVYQGEVALDDDDLLIDNRHYFTHPVSPRPSMLVIDEAQRGTRRDAFFIRTVFDLGEDALYQFSEGGRGRITRAVLRGQQAVFLTNLSTLSSAQRGSLQRYVEDGGSLVMSFGEQTDPVAFSTALQEWGIGRIEGTVVPRTLQGQDAIIGEVDLRHPIFNIFAASGTSAIFRPSFRQYIKIVPDANAAVLGTYDTEDPFLIERRLGQGTILVYTSTFNTNWTDFPVEEMYVPFLYQLARYAIQDANAEQAYLVGDVVALDGREGEIWEVRTPDGNLFKVDIGDGGTGFFRETDDPGHYVAAKGRELYHFSVNVDPRESDLQSRDVEEAYAAVVPPADPLAADPETAAAMALEEAEEDQKFWRVLLLLVLALFAFETYYANRKRKALNVGTLNSPRPDLIRC